MCDKSMKEFTPDVLADVLLGEYVLKKEENKHFELDPKWGIAENFNDIVMLYKIALVLIALLNVESKNIIYYQVRICFEKLVFRDGNVEKLGFYYDVKSAMEKLGELLDNRDDNFYNLKEQINKIPWTLACLREAGVLKDDQHIVQSGHSVVWIGWAMAWLRSAGIVELNPAKLMQFAVMWIDNYIAIKNYVNNINSNIT